MKTVKDFPLKCFAIYGSLFHIDKSHGSESQDKGTACMYTLNM